MLCVGNAAPKISKTAAADVYFRCQNSYEGEARPLPQAEMGEQLTSSMLQSGLYAINGRNGQRSILGALLTVTSAP